MRERNLIVFGNDIKDKMDIFIFYLIMIDKI